MSALNRHDSKASFALFKQKLFAELGAKGFSLSSDIARRKVDDQIDMQLVVAGNGYYCFLTIQVLMSRAVAELRKRAISLSLPRRYDFDGRDVPIFSDDLTEIGIHLPSVIREGLNNMEWDKLIYSIDHLSYYILHVDEIERVKHLSLFKRPSSISQEQAAILAIFLQLANQKHIIMADGHIVDGGSFDKMGPYEELI